MRMCLNRAPPEIVTCSRDASDPGNDAFLCTHHNPKEFNLPVPVHNDRLESIIRETVDSMRKDRSPSLPTNDILDLPTLNDHFRLTSSPPRAWTCSSPPEQSAVMEQVTLNELLANPHTPTLTKKRQYSEVGDCEDEKIPPCGDDSIAFGSLLKDAREHFGKKKPEFCVTSSNERLRPVELAQLGETVYIRFRLWNKGANDWGFWVLTTSDNVCRIVKLLRGRYFCWQGVGKGLAKVPIAFSINDKKSSIPNPPLKATLNQENLTQRRFRPRSVVQAMPFTADKAMHKFEGQGIKLSSEELELQLSRALPTPCPVKEQNHSKSDDRKSSSISPLTSPSRAPRSPSQASTIASSTIVSNPTARSTDAMVRARARLRVREKGFSGPSFTVYLEDCASNLQIFDRITKKVSFLLRGKRIIYCVVKFSWLGDDASIFVQRNEEDDYRILMERLSCAPGWRTGEEVEADVEWHTT